VKFDFLQSDFSTGELAPGAQGHVDSPAYKAGLSLAANCAPTRTGSIASRAGLKALFDGVDGNTGAASNLPVQHLVVHDGPTGDFVVEVSPTGIRLMDKTGILPWDFYPPTYFIQYTVQDGDFAYGDGESVYLRSEAGSGDRSYYLTHGTGAQNAVVQATATLGLPVGTSDAWILSGRVAGDAVTARVFQPASGLFQDLAISHGGGDGSFSINFRPDQGGIYEDFYIQLRAAAGDATSVLWDLRLTKDAVKVIQDTTAVLIPVTFNGAKVAPAQDRIRCAAFWAQGDFWVAFAGGPDNAYAGFALRWAAGARIWTFGTLPCTPNSLAQIQGATTVAVYQNRLWYGLNLLNGKKAIRASVVGFGKPWGLAAQAGSTGSPVTLIDRSDLALPYLSITWLFQFIVETETFTATAGQTQYDYSFPCPDPRANLIVKLLDASSPHYGWVVAKLWTHLLPNRAGVDWRGTTDFQNDFLGDLAKSDYITANPSTPMDERIRDQTVYPGGTAYFRPPDTFPLGYPGGIGDPPAGNPPGGPDKWSLKAGDTLQVTRVPVADDPLDLDLASPTGKIAWLNVLRGLILGTSRNEKLFSQQQALSRGPGHRMGVRRSGREQPRRRPRAPRPGHQRPRPVRPARAQGAPARRHHHHHRRRSHVGRRGRRW
jgi:hypothetical protein